MARNTPSTPRPSVNAPTDVLPVQRTRKPASAPEAPLTGTVLPVTTADYQAAKKAFQGTAKVAETASKTLRPIVEAEAYEGYGFAGPAELFADFLNGLPLPGKLTTGDNLAIVAALVNQKAGTSDEIAEWIGAAGKSTITYVRKAAIDAGLIASNGNGNGSDTPADKTSGKAKVTDNGMVRVPAFDVTPENAERLAKYLAKMGVTLELPE